ncbi:MAG: radical SAM family heme chaperone HemW, partial [Dehalobacterium sp.]
MNQKEDSIIECNDHTKPIGINDNALPDIEAIYVHIPFCIKKCHYCDFVSYPVNGSPVEEYCQGLINEGKMYHRFLSGSQKEIKSIYIGGGTPTCLPAACLAKILDRLAGFFPVGQNGEITVECNPQTVNKEYLYQLKKIGVNRLSIGAQAFDASLLHDMGRVHGVEDIEKTVFDARETGFININLDLIYGLPGQTWEQWSATLAYAIALPITHLSVYGLKLSEHSPWGEYYARGSLILPDEDTFAEMQEQAIDYLTEQGFNHYEIANFALPGFFSVHNRVYWKNGNYLGLGLAASSHWANIRQTNC